MAAWFEDVLDWVVPSRDKCRQAAMELVAAHPGESREQLARRAVASARNWAAAAGGATGIAANPFAMVPAALADMGAVLRIEGTMAGVIGALLDPRSLDDGKAFDADVICIVFPGAVSQALRHIGVGMGQRITQNLIRKYLSESFLKEATGFAGKYLFIKVSEKAVVSKTVPLVGAGIGAAWNWTELQLVGRRAIRYYQNREIGPEVGAPDPTRVQRLREWVRALPWPTRDRGEGDAPLLTPAPPVGGKARPLLPGPPGQEKGRRKRD